MGTDTTTPAGEFLTAVFPGLSPDKRERIERTLLAIPDTVSTDQRKVGERIRNRLLGCLDDYNRLFEPRIAKVRAEYAKGPVGKPSPSVDESLEAHIRVYVVNALLAALNWRLDANLKMASPT